MDAAGAPLPRLIVDRVPDDFEAGRDTAIGAWCFHGSESIVPDWERHLPDDTFDSVEDQIRSDAAIAAIAHRLLPEWAESLNRRHGVTRSHRFWYLVLMRWMLEVLAVAYCRFREVERLTERGAGPSLHASIAPEQVAWNFRDLHDLYQRGTYSPAYNHWLASLALRVLVPSNVTLETRPLSIDPPPGVERSGRATISQRFNSWIKDGRADIGAGLTEFDLATKAKSVVAHLALDLYLGAMPRKRRIRTSDDHRIDTSAADNLPEAFTRMARKALDGSLLAAHGTDFQRLDAAGRKARATPGRLNVRTTQFHFDDRTLFRLAHRLERGEGLVFVQHGGLYGLPAAFSLGAETEYRQHAFISWGWQEHADHGGTILPLPAPQLAPWHRRHRGTGDRLLLITNLVRLITARTIAVGETFNKPHQRRDKLAFLSALDTDVSSAVVYRPYHATTGAVDDTDYLRSRLPGLRIDEDALHRSLSRCRLLVLDYPGTPLSIALAAGTPFVAFWRPDVWPLCSQARPYFDALRDCGIIHADAAAAAHHVNAIWGDVAAWWATPELRDAVERFRGRYARSHRLWWLDWARALWRI